MRHINSPTGEPIQDSRPSDQIARNPVTPWCGPASFCLIFSLAEISMLKISRYKTFDYLLTYWSTPYTMFAVWNPYLKEHVVMKITNLPNLQRQCIARIIIYPVLVKFTMNAYQFRWKIVNSYLPKSTLKSSYYLKLTIFTGPGQLNYPKPMI